MVSVTSIPPTELIVYWESGTNRLYTWGELPYGISSNLVTPAPPSDFGLHKMDILMQGRIKPQINVLIALLSCLKKEDGRLMGIV